MLPYTRLLFALLLFTSTSVIGQDNLPPRDLPIPQEETEWPEPDQKSDDRFNKIIETTSAIPLADIQVIRTKKLLPYLTLTADQDQRIGQVQHRDPGEIQMTALVHLNPLKMPSKEFDRYLSKLKSLCYAESRSSDDEVADILTREQAERLDRVKFFHHLEHRQVKQAFSSMGVEPDDEGFKPFSQKLLQFEGMNAQILYSMHRQAAIELLGKRLPRFDELCGTPEPLDISDEKQDWVDSAMALDAESRPELVPPALFHLHAHRRYRVIRRSENLHLASLADFMVKVGSAVNPDFTPDEQARFDAIWNERYRSSKSIARAHENDVEAIDVEMIALRDSVDREFKELLGDDRTKQLEQRRFELFAIHWLDLHSALIASGQAVDAKAEKLIRDLNTEIQEVQMKLFRFRESTFRNLVEQDIDNPTVRDQMLAAIETAFDVGKSAKAAPANPRRRR